MDALFDVSARKKRALKEPDEFYVLLLNDNFTPMDFVTHVIMSIFNKPEAEAVHIMMDVHTKGRGIVGRYTRDIAFTKARQTDTESEARGFPLKCIVEKA